MIVNTLLRSDCICGCSCGLYNQPHVQLATDIQCEAESTISRCVHWLKPVLKHYNNDDSADQQDGIGLNEWGWEPLIMSLIMTRTGRVQHSKPGLTVTLALRENHDSLSHWRGMRIRVLHVR
jgi:hypothetical protein